MSCNILFRSVMPAQAVKKYSNKEFITHRHLLGVTLNCVFVTFATWVELLHPFPLPPLLDPGLYRAAGALTTQDPPQRLRALSQPCWLPDGRLQPVRLRLPKDPHSGWLLWYIQYTNTNAENQTLHTLWHITTIWTCGLTHAESKQTQNPCIWKC